MIITIYIGVQANKIAIRNQPLDYSVTADQQLDMIMMDDQVYTLTGVTFEQIKGNWSGELSSVFLATVNEDKIDIAHIPDEIDKNTGFTHNIYGKIVYQINPNNPKMLLFGPYGIDLSTMKKEPQMFHLVFKGYNKEYTIYTVVYTVNDNIDAKTDVYKEDTNGKDIEFSYYYGTLNIYILDEDSMYDYLLLQQIANDVNAFKNKGEEYSSRDILDLVNIERNMCYEEFNEAS